MVPSKVTQCKDNTLVAPAPNPCPSPPPGPSLASRPSVLIKLSARPHEAEGGDHTQFSSALPKLYLRAPAQGAQACCQDQVQGCRGTPKEWVPQLAEVGAQGSGRIDPRNDAMYRHKTPTTESLTHWEVTHIWRPKHRDTELHGPRGRCRHGGHSPRGWGQPAPPTEVRCPRSTDAHGARMPGAQTQP